MLAKHLRRILREIRQVASISVPSRVAQPTRSVTVSHVVEFPKFIWRRWVDCPPRRHKHLRHDVRSRAVEWTCSHQQRVVVAYCARRIRLRVVSSSPRHRNDVVYGREGAECSPAAYGIKVRQSSVEAVPELSEFHGKSGERHEARAREHCLLHRLVGLELLDPVVDESSPRDARHTNLHPAVKDSCEFLRRMSLDCGTHVSAQVKVPKQAPSCL